MTEILVHVIVTFKKSGDYYKHILRINEGSIVYYGNMTLNDYVESAFEVAYPDRSEIDIEIKDIKDIGENCSWARHITLERLLKHIGGERYEGPLFEGPIVYAVRVATTSPWESKPEVLVVPELDNLAYEKEKTLKKTYNKVVEDKPRKKVSIWVYFWTVSALMLVAAYLFENVFN